MFCESNQHNFKKDNDKYIQFVEENTQLQRHRTCEFNYRTQLLAYVHTHIYMMSLTTSNIIK